MANKDQPRGFEPWGGLIEVRPFWSEAYSATPIYVHTVVAIASDGYIDPGAADSKYIVGSSLGKLTSGDAAKIILVASSPNQLFRAQADEDDLSSIACVGTLADHVGESGTAALFLSTDEIDSSSASAAQAGWLILDKDNRPDNAWGEHVDVIVRCDEHFMGAGGAGYV